MDLPLPPILFSFRLWSSGKLPAVERQIQQIEHNRYADDASADPEGHLQGGFGIFLHRLGCGCLRVEDRARNRLGVTTWEGWVWAVVFYHF